MLFAGVSSILESIFKRLMEFGQGKKKISGALYLTDGWKKVHEKNIMIIALCKSDTLQSLFVVK